MAGLLKFLAVFYARETVGTISRGGTARSWNEKKERERGPGRGIGGVRKGEGHATLSGPGLNLATSTPTLTNRCGYVPLDTPRAHFTTTTSGFILSPASFAPLLGPVSRTGLQNFPLMKDVWNESYFINEISYSLIDVE